MSLRVKFLEINSWIFNAGSIEVVVDPVLASALDFGMPYLYTGRRKLLDGQDELLNIIRSSDYVLLSQSIDDHCHVPTIKVLSSERPDLIYIAPPSSVDILTACGVASQMIRVLSHGDTLSLLKGHDTVKITTTIGASVGPPWSTRENGYILNYNGVCSLYYEPHGMFLESELQREDYRADYVIAPMVSQRLLSYTLVNGWEKAVELARLLKARAIIPMANGDLVQSGLLSKLIQFRGSVQETREFLQRHKNDLEVLDVYPGQSILLSGSAVT